MKKTRPLKRLPKRLPSFLDDLALRNFGTYRGRPVCHDYGTTRMFQFLVTNSSLRTPHEINAEIARDAKVLKNPAGLFDLRRMRTLWEKEEL